VFVRIDRHVSFIELQLQRWGLAAGTPPPACGRIDSGNILVPGESRWSCNGRFTLAHQTDGNVVLYDGPSSPLWASNTSGRSSTSLIMQSDGNLVVYSSSNSPRWASGTASANLGSTNCFGSNFALTDVYFGWNAAGGDYTSLILAQPRASWCAYYCSQDSRCQLFTYVPPGIQNAQAVCWLKDSAVTWVADSRMVSGIIVQ